MGTVLLTIHIIVAILLIIVVLMQRGQAGDLGSAFGGGSSQSLFGSGGSSSFLGTATAVLATTFMITSLTLAFFSQKQTSSVLDQGFESGIVQEQGIPEAGDTGTVFDPAMLKEDAVEDALPTAE